MANLNIMIGLPGSGKTTYAKKYLINDKTVYLSSDDIRIDMFGYEDQSHNQEVFERMQKEAIMALKENFDVIYDATNLSRKRRALFIKLIRDKFDKNVNINAYLACAPINIILERNITRTERHLPWDKLELLIKSIEPPMYYEGFNNIYLIDGGMYDDIYDYNILIKKYKGYKQDNPHHKETLDEHIQNVVNNVEKYNNNILRQTARYHDFGKIYTRILNKKGYYSYYGHEKLSTYIYLCHMRKQSMLNNFNAVELSDNIYKIAALILNHMEWYNRDNMDIIKERLGNELFELLEIFHKADKEGSISVNDK